MTRKWYHLALVSVVAAVAALTVAASTTSAGTTATQARGSGAATVTQIGNVNVTLRIGKFVKHGRRLMAVGTAIAQFTPTAGNPAGLPPATTSQRFTATVTTLRHFDAAQRICPVLNLTLGPLDLNLLGLMVHLDRVHLTITANSRGGLLGRLFCSLSHARVGLGLQAKRLTRAVHASGLATKGVKMQVPLFQNANGGISTGASDAPATICPVLDLAVGPLDLNLLGLMVHLDRVHLTITADSTGGILGQLLCSLAGGARASR